MKKELKKGDVLILQNAAYVPYTVKKSRSGDTEEAQEPISVAEVVQVIEEGKDLVYRIKEVKEDGTVTYSEVMWVGDQLLKILRLPAVVKAVERVGSWIQRLRQRRKERRAK